MTEKNIKSPTVEEIETALDNDKTPGENVKRIKPANKPAPAKTKNSECKMKDEADSFFEPEAELFLLPTKRKVYAGEGITDEGKIYVRRFTTKEENLVQSALIKEKNSSGMTLNTFLHIINEALDNCIKSDVSIYDLAIIDKIPMLVKIISMSYGKKLKITIPCEECEKEHEIEINLDKDFVVNYISDKFPSPKTIKLEKFSFPVEIDLTIPTVIDEDAFSGETVDLIRQFEAMIVEARGTKPDGEPITRKDIPLIVENIHQDDKEQVKKYINSFSEIGTDLQLNPISLCTNKKCSLFNAPVSPIVPLRFILSQLIS